MAPEFFVRSVMHTEIAERFLVKTTFGISLLESLEPHGVFSTVEKRASPKFQRSRLIMVLASITMMLSGADHIESVPADVMLEIIKFFRTPDGLRWREGFLNSDQVASTCFREVTRALGKYYNDDRILANAPQSRIKSGRDGVTWEYFSKNSTPLQKEILDYYQRYSATSTSSPKIDRQILLSLDKLIQEGGFTSLREAMLLESLTDAIANLYESRSETWTPSLLLNLRLTKRFSDFLLAEMADIYPDETFFPLVSEKKLGAVINMVGHGSGKPSQSSARPLPERFYFFAKEILEEGEGGWPGENFRAEVIVQGQLKDIYCPVVPTLIRCLFELPLRTVQFRRFDSGEGDIRRFNGNTLTWETNTSPHAGHWYRTGRAGKDETRGYAYEFQESEPKITGISVNTNKTGKPYVIPWMSDELHKLLYDLAEWQIAYNPVSRPITPSEYLDDLLPDVTVEKLPDIFALFRMPPTARNPLPGIPPSHGYVGKAFNLLQMEIERRWNERNPTESVRLVISFNDKIKQPEKCAYSLHGLRVRGISALHKAGVPIEIISKIVAGHATVAMTLYYLMLDPVHLSRKLTAAMSSSSSKEISSFTDDLKNMQVEEARLRTTYVDENTLVAFSRADRNLFCDVNIGVCLEDGKGCDKGGAPIYSDKAGSKGVIKDYAPVRGGAKNCIWCRHFMSGTPFIFQLELFGTKLLWRRNERSQILQEQRQELQFLHRSKNEGAISSSEFKIRAGRLRAENNTLRDEIEDIDEAIFRTTLHLNAASRIVKRDIESGKKPGVALVANDGASAVGYRDHTSFDLVAILARAGRFWTILKDDKVEGVRKEFIDQMMFNAGQVPLSLRTDLTKSEREASADIISQFLLEQVSTEDRTALASGHLKLQDLRVRDQVDQLVEKVVLEARSHSSHLMISLPQSEE